MSSTLQLQLDPPLENVMAHLSFPGGALTMDDAGNVDGDWDERKSNAAGYIAFQKVDPGPATVWVRAPGYELVKLPPVSMPHDDVIIVPLKPAGTERGQLRTRGTYFITEDDKPWLFAGYASYTIISEVAKGKDIDGFLDEAIRYGANTLVALGMDLGPFAHDHGFAVDPRHPEWPHWLEAIYERTAAKGLRSAIGCFQQAQPLSDAEKRRAWDVFCEVARGRWNALPRAGNEDDVNGWDHKALPRPSNMRGVLVSTGSRGINNPPTPPNWDWAEWEPPRSPRAKTFSDAGGAGWYMTDGYPEFPAVPCPIVCIEPPFFHETTRDQYGDERWCNPADALTLGLNIGGNFAGGAFGSSESLETRSNGPIAAECARQFFRGLRAGFQR